jgi:hypothetical protein
MNFVFIGAPSVEVVWANTTFCLFIADERAIKTMDPDANPVPQQLSPEVFLLINGRTGGIISAAVHFYNTDGRDQAQNC